MLYAILCYNDEDVVWSWSQEEDAAVMAKLGVVHERWVQAGKLGHAVTARASGRNRAIGRTS